MRQKERLSAKSYFLQFITFGKQHKLFIPFFGGCFFLPLYLIPFLPGYDPSKWVLLYIFSSLSLILIIPGSCIYVPSLNRTQSYLLAGLGVGLVFNYFYHENHFLGKETLDRLMFWSLVFCYCTCFKPFDFSEKKNFFYPLFLGTSVFVVGGFLNFIFVKPQLSFTFGNLNKAAEFVGFSLVLQLGLLSSYSKKMQKWLILLISLSLTYIYFAKCRSVWIGIACVFVYLIGTKKVSQRSLFHIFFGVLALILSFEIILLFKGEVPLNLSAKEGSFSERWQILLNTLALAWDHPLGIGFGRFGFAAAPYMQNLPQNAFTEMYQLFSPYNEALRFLVEEGIIICLLLLSLCISFIYPFQKLECLSRMCPESVAFLIFFLVQSAFQYPLNQPFGLFLLPFILSYTAHYTIGLHPLYVPYLPSLKVTLAILFGCAALALGVTMHVNSSFPFDTTLAKTLYPFWKDQNLLKIILSNSYLNEDYKETKTFALQELKKEPQNLIALKYLGLANIKTGERKEGCTQLILYNNTFSLRSSVFKEIHEYCKEKKPYF
jgi:hypothetical protein